MKYCDKCGADNFSETRFCRKCNYEFKDVDANFTKEKYRNAIQTNENPNLVIDSYIYENQLSADWRYIDYIDKFLNKYDDINLDLKKDGIIFFFISFISLFFCYWGFYNSWIVYYLVAIIYYYLFSSKYYKLLFMLFGIKLESNADGVRVYNDRLPGFVLIHSCLFLLVLILPLTQNPSIFFIVRSGMGIVLLLLVYGLGVFLRPGTFNQYTGYFSLFFPFHFLMMERKRTNILKSISSLSYASYLFGSIITFFFINAILSDKSVVTLNHSFCVIALIIWIIGIFWIVFPDKINKISPSEIREIPGIWSYVLISIILSLLPVIILFLGLFVSGQFFW